MFQPQIVQFYCYYYYFCYCYYYFFYFRLKPFVLDFFAGKVNYTRGRFLIFFPLKKHIGLTNHSSATELNNSSKICMLFYVSASDCTVQIFETFVL